MGCHLFSKRHPNKPCWHVRYDALPEMLHFFWCILVKQEDCTMQSAGTIPDSALLLHSPPISVHSCITSLECCYAHLSWWLSLCKTLCQSMSPLQLSTEHKNTAIEHCMLCLVAIHYTNWLYNHHTHSFAVTKTMYCNQNYCYWIMQSLKLLWWTFQKWYQYYCKKNNYQMHVTWG